MWVFGGKDEDNQKLKDLWSFDIQTSAWTQHDCDLKSLLPRSGHSACVYEDWMLIFGGIHEITKELEDMAVYNFKTQEWIHFFKTAQDKAMKK